MHDKLQTQLGKIVVCLLWICIAGIILNVAVDTFFMWPNKASQEALSRAEAAHIPVILLAFIHGVYSLLLRLARLPWWIWIPAVVIPLLAVIFQNAGDIPNDHAFLIYLAGTALMAITMFITGIVASIKQNRNQKNTGNS